MDQSDYRPVSTGYMLSLLVALAGLTFAVIAFVGACEAAGGHDPMFAMGWPGQITFAGSFGLLFATRLIFWRRSPLGLQRLVRTALTLLLVIGVALTLGAGVLALRSAAASIHPAFVTGMTLAAAICQIGAILWLARYRNE